MRVTRTTGWSYHLTTTLQIPFSMVSVTIQLYVTRLNEESRQTRAPLPDVMIAEHLHDPVVPNVDNMLWWTPRNGAKYLAGTCACRTFSG